MAVLGLLSSRARWVGGALLAWWVIRISTGRSTLPPALAWTGRAGVIVAAATGLIHLVHEVAAILAAAWIARARA